MHLDWVQACWTRRNNPGASALSPELVSSFVLFSQGTCCFGLQIEAHKLKPFFGLKIALEGFVDAEQMADLTARAAENGTVAGNMYSALSNIVPPSQLLERWGNDDTLCNLVFSIESLAFFRRQDCPPRVGDAHRDGVRHDPLSSNSKRREIHDKQGR
jgi:hypothetical protein